MLICTGDRDSFQLVNDRTTVLYPMRGVSEMARMTPAAVEERYGVAPARYPELAALVGETSDNLPGVPGVGPKTAAKWINQYDGLDNVVAQADEITGKEGESLREHLGDVMRNRQLNALVRDLDLPLDPGRPRARSRGTARRCTRSSTASSSGCCATGCSRRCDVRGGPIDDSGFELAGVGPGRRRGRRLARPSTPARRTRAGPE